MQTLLKKAIQKDPLRTIKKKRQKVGRKKKVHLIYLTISPTTTEKQHFSTVGN